MEKEYYDSLKAMKRKYDLLSRKEAFSGSTKEEWISWKEQMKKRLWDLLGMDHMESCDLCPIEEETVVLENGITRKKVRIQTEPDVWMPFFELIPPERDQKREIFLALAGHGGAGKYGVAGCREIPVMRQAIERHHYDYGMKLAEMGYTVFCPDPRGFGERREAARQSDREEDFLNGCCYELAHMAEPLGMTVAGMQTWDLMRLLDYVQMRADIGECTMENLGCVGFSGGGMQTLWLTALDDRIRRALTSGYLYGVKDSLLELNQNCSCNYVPGLWQVLDMGDLASMAAPRPFIVQTGLSDGLNGKRGAVNADEQMETVRRAYRLFDAENVLIHHHYPGGHQFHYEDLAEDLSKSCRNNQEKEK